MLLATASLALGLVSAVSASALPQRRALDLTEPEVSFEELSQRNNEPIIGYLYNGRFTAFEEDHVFPAWRCKPRHHSKKPTGTGTHPTTPCTTGKGPTTSAKPPPTTSAKPPPTTSAKPPPTTSAKPPPTTSAKPPPTTSAKPPPTTSAKPPPTTSAKPPPTTSAKPPPTTSAKPPPTTTKAPTTSSKPTTTGCASSRKRSLGPLAHIYRRDFNQLKTDVANIATGVNTVKTKLNAFTADSGYAEALAIDSAAQDLLKTLQTATADAKSTGKLDLADSQAGIKVLGDLIPNVVSTLDVFASKEPVFKAKMVAAIAKADNASLNKASDDFADALLAIADPCVQAQGKGYKSQLDAAFAKSTAAYKND